MTSTPSPSSLSSSAILVAMLVEQRLSSLAGDAGTESPTESSGTIGLIFFGRPTGRPVDLLLRFRFGKKPIRPSVGVAAAAAAPASAGADPSDGGGGGIVGWGGGGCCWPSNRRSSCFWRTARGRRKNSRKNKYTYLYTQ